MTEIEKSKSDVLILSTGFPRWIPDVYVPFLWEYARGLARLFETVTVCVPSSGHPNEKKAESLEGVMIHRFNYFFPKHLQRLCYGSGIPDNLRKSFLAWVQIPFLMLAMTIQVFLQGRRKRLVYCHWVPTLIPALLHRAIFGTRCVLVLHGSDLRVLPRFLVRPLLKASDAIVTGHEELVDKVREMVPHLQVELIRNFIDENKFKPVQGARANRVIAVGRLVPSKDPLFFFEVAGRIASEFPETEFVWVGHGLLRDEVEAKIATMGLANVKCLGPRTDVAELVQQSKAAFFSDTLDNLWSTTLIESILCETPCVLNDVGSTQTAFQDERQCLLYRKGNVDQAAQQLRRLLLGRVDLKKMTRAAFEMIENKGFLSEKILDAHRRLTDRLLQSRVAKPGA